VDELKFVMTKIGETLTDNEIRDFVNDVDADGDGRVTYDGEHSQSSQTSCSRTPIKEN